MNDYYRHLEEAVYNLESARASIEALVALATFPSLQQLAQPDLMAFIESFERAHLTTAVLTLHQLGDTRTGTVGFTHLLNVARSLERITDADAAQVEVELHATAPLSRSVAILRHEVFAHRTAGRTRDDSFRAASLTHQDLLDLTDHYLVVLNRLLKLAGRPAAVFDRAVSSSVHLALKLLSHGG